ncbi:hypothetical protein ElyMa_003259100 [Elysia marginata]|uniref:Uncharacterized protein n=1 Tax=Elysia marginata TaxID=1093978 RepID=A0AAV4J623_9GAST|nr:hypothetical protein ElyMa_003259100 [Elysia marginata]
MLMVSTHSGLVVDGWVVDREVWVRVLGYNPTLKEAKSMIDSVDADVDADGEYTQWSSGRRSGFGPRGLGFESWATTRHRA